MSLINSATAIAALLLTVRQRSSEIAGSQCAVFSLMITVRSDQEASQVRGESALQCRVGHAGKQVWRVRRIPLHKDRLGDFFQYCYLLLSWLLIRLARRRCTSFIYAFKFIKFAVVTCQQTARRCRYGPTKNIPSQRTVGLLLNELERNFDLMLFCDMSS
jgi:hypothetical protein